MLVGASADRSFEHLPRSFRVLRHVEIPFAHRPQERGRLNESQEHHRYGARIRIGTDLAAFLAFTNYISDFLKVCPDNIVNSRSSVRTATEHGLSKYDTRDPRVLPNKDHMSHQQIVQPAHGVGGFRATRSTFLRSRPRTRSIVALIISSLFRKCRYTADGTSPTRRATPETLTACMPRSARRPRAA